MEERALPQPASRNELSLEVLSDAELESRLKRLAGIERRALAILLAHLGEFDHRKLYADRGRPSLFAYCTQVLGYSEQGAYKRIQAARVARHFGSLFQRLTDGEISLTAIVILAPHLRVDNLDAVLNAAKGKRTRELEILAAALAPRPDVPDCLRALPAPDNHPNPETTIDSKEATKEQAPSLSVLADKCRPTRELMDPLSPERHLFRFTGSSAFRKKFERARELLNIDRSEGAMETVFEAGLQALLERRDPEFRIKRRILRSRGRDLNPAGLSGSRREKKSASRSRPRTGGTDHSSNLRHIPAALRDAVWKRDGGQCTFVGSDNNRCPGTTHLEVDHIIPFALGGKSDALTNLRLMCRAHNQLLARRQFRTKGQLSLRIV